MTTLRILHVIPSLSLKHGGPSVALRAFAKALIEAGVEVTVATTDDDGPGGRLDVARGKLLADADGWRKIYFVKQTEFYKLSLGLRRWLRRNVRNFDVVHIHALFSYSSVIAARTAQAHRVPYIIRPLGVLNRWGMENRRRLLKRWSFELIELPILRKAAAIHYTAEAERLEASIAAPDLATPSVIIPVPVESIVSGDPERLRLRFPKLFGGPVVLFLSRISAKKRLEVLLDAMREVRGHVPDVRLLIVGDGEADYVRRLQEQAHRLHLDDVAVWAGHIDGEDKAAAFRLANVFVLPSASENFGIAVAEAFASRLPVVMSAGVAISEDAIKHNAASVVADDSASVAAAIVELLVDREKAERQATNAAAMVAERYSLAAVGRELKRVYQFAVDNRSRS